MEIIKRWGMVLVGFGALAPIGSAWGCQEPHLSVCMDEASCDWRLEVRGLLLKPIGSDVGFAVQTTPYHFFSARTPALFAATPVWNVLNFDPRYHGAFDVAGSVRLPGTAGRVMLNWQRFNSCTGATFAASGPSFVGPFFKAGPEAANYKQADGTLQLNCNEGNLTLGYGVQWGSAVHTTFFGGVSYAQIKHAKNSTFSSLDEVSILQVSTPIQFRGGGLQAGVDGFWQFCKAWRLTGKLYASALVGSSTNGSIYRAWSAGLDVAEVFYPPNVQWTNVQKTSALVPVLAERVGLAYEEMINGCARIAVEIGYQAQVFIGAVQSVEVSSEWPGVTSPTTGTLGVYARSFQQKTSNFALAGPYMSVEVRF